MVQRPPKYGIFLYFAFYYPFCKSEDSNDARRSGRLFFIDIRHLAVFYYQQTGPNMSASQRTETAGGHLCNLRRSIDVIKETYAIERQF